MQRKSLLNSLNSSSPNKQKKQELSELELLPSLSSASSSPLSPSLSSLSSMPSMPSVSSGVSSVQSEDQYWQSLEEWNQEHQAKENGSRNTASKNEVLEVLNEEAPENSTKKNLSFKELKEKEFAEKLPSFWDAMLDSHRFEKKNPSRRDFFKSMGWGLGTLAVASACTKAPVRKAAPYIFQPEETTPGVANWYASTCSSCSSGCSVLVKTREGRPIKIEGNSDSEINQGGLCAMGQASILSLYDIDRAKTPLKSGNPVTWSAVDSSIRKKLDELRRRNSQIRIVSSTISSPTMMKVMEDFVQKYPNARHVSYDPISYSALIEAHSLSFNQEMIPGIHLDRAEVLVSFSADFLGTWLSPVEFTRDFVSLRSAENLEKKKTLSRFIQFESILSITGAKADLRVPIKASEESLAILYLYELLAKEKGVLQGSSLAKPLLRKEIRSSIESSAKELWQARKKALVFSSSNDLSTQILLVHINALLESYGNTLDLDRFSHQKKGIDSQMKELVEEIKRGEVFALFFYQANPVYDYPNFPSEKLREIDLTVSLSDRIDETASFVEYLCPDHHFLESWHSHKPKEGFFTLTQPTIQPLNQTRSAGDSFLIWMDKKVSYFDLMKNFFRQITFPQKNRSEKPIQQPQTFFSTNSGTNSEKPNETSSNTNLSQNLTQVFDSKQNTILQTDTDANTKDATTQKIDSQNSLPTSNSIASSASSDLPKSVENTLQNKEERDFFFARSDWGNFWNRFVHDGIWDSQASSSSNSSSNSSRRLNNPVSDIESAKKKILENKVDSSSLELVLYQTVALREGRYNNNAWLQELPDPISKVTWDHFASISPKQAKEKGLRDGDVVELRVGNRTETLPILIQVGQAYGTIAISLGYGRTHVGRIGNQIGKNFYSFVQQRDGNLSYYSAGVEIQKTGSSSSFAQTQTYHYLEEPFTGKKRPIIRETNLKEYQKDPRSGNHDSHSVPSIWDRRPELKQSEYQWGMAIDLNSCVGCSACMIACQSENNIPVVGKEEVARRRDMHWIRIDRYYSKNPENPKTSFQPMTCQHCENAPCETVCPVLATTHSFDGLNQQTYNRCVGTRYCANNCPYKVRRFNWFEYSNNPKFDFHLNNSLGKLASNPDVTVRGRGVMEKCTFCIQRIQEKRLQAKKEKRPIQDGEIKTACEQSCPAKAIVFGNLKDPNSRVSKLYQNPRRYHVLEELNVRPSIGYLTQVRNTV